MLFDTHSHPFDEAFDFDRDEVMNRTKNMRLMIVGFNEKTNLKAIELANEYGFFYSVGIHPTDVKNTDYLYFNTLEKLLKDAKAIGECGLDYYWDKDNKEEQKKYFVKQIELSIAYNLPIIIHCRDAIMDCFELLQPYKGKIKGVMHSFSGSYEMAMRFIDLGLYIGLGGPVTFKNAVAPKDVAKRIPIDRILIETDCPYLTPHPFRGKRNEPSYVSYVAKEIAQLREISYEDVCKITCHNGNILFGLEE